MQAALGTLPEDKLDALDAVFTPAKLLYKDITQQTANDLAAGFGSSPIAEESIKFSEGDPTFAIAPTADSVTQSATAIFDDSVVTEKFFKAAIEAYANNYPEQPEPEDPEE